MAKKVEEVLLEQGKPWTVSAFPSCSDAQHTHARAHSLWRVTLLTSALKTPYDHVCPLELRWEGARGIPRSVLTRLHLLSCYTLGGKEAHSSVSLYSRQPPSPGAPGSLALSLRRRARLLPPYAEKPTLVN